MTDVLAASECLETYSGLEPVGNEHRNLARLQDDSGLILSLFRGDKITEPERAHVGFIRASEAAVGEPYRRPTEGVRADPPPHSYGHTFS